MAADIFWNLLRPLADRGQPIFMHLVPAHRGLSGNERTDAFAREASALPQLETPVDIRTIQRVVVRSAASSWKQELAGRLVSFHLAGPASGPGRGDRPELRASHWSGSEQYLQKVGRRPTPDYTQCSSMQCPAALCGLCREEADTPRHVLLRCPALAGRRLRRLGTIYPDVTLARDDGVVTSFTSGYRAQLSRIGYVS